MSANNIIEQLSKSITPQTKGIIWLTDELLDYSSPNSYEINYLLNGMLIKSLASSDAEDRHTQNFYLGESFGNPFFVAHLVISEAKDLKQIGSVFNLAKPFIQTNDQVYILNRSKNTANINVYKELSEKYKDISFAHLNI